MAGFFTGQQHVIKIDDENSVTVKRPTQGERQEAVARAMRSGEEGTLQAMRLQSEMLKVIIVDWDGPSFEGREVSKDAITSLPDWLSDYIMNHASDGLPDLSEEEKNE